MNYMFYKPDLTDSLRFVHSHHTICVMLSALLNNIYFHDTDHTTLLKKKKSLLLLYSTTVDSVCGSLLSLGTVHTVHTVHTADQFTPTQQRHLPTSLPASRSSMHLSSAWALCTKLTISLPHNHGTLSLFSLPCPCGAHLHMVGMLWFMSDRNQPSLPILFS